MKSRELNFLADLIEAQRLFWPPDASQLRSAGISGDEAAYWRLLAGAATAGASAPTAAWILRRLAEEVVQREAAESAIQPVASGPRIVTGLRGTEDAFHEVIDQAVHRLLITGFVLHNGHTVLRHLANRIDTHPALDVVLCLDVSRAPADTTDDQAIIAGFAGRFRQTEWPGRRLPRLYYDPRSLARGADDRSVLHAKVAIADTSRALIGSANLTEAALQRNIEIGVLMSAPTPIALVRAHFEALIHNGVLLQVPL
jgi:phosphatidylserine/phosphatidylglycerophosphate/cardiolipin synthase-like enzyme